MENKEQYINEILELLRQLSPISDKDTDGYELTDDDGEEVVIFGDDEDRGED